MSTINVLTVLAPDGKPITFVDPSTRVLEAAENGIGPFSNIHGWAVRTVDVPDTCTHCEVEPYDDYGDDDCARVVHFVTGYVKAPGNELCVAMAYDADVDELVHSTVR